MATIKRKTKKQQHQELIDTLKFTPVNYTIEIGAYGGEVYYGTVDRKIYDFFRDHKIDIGEYASDWDDDKWEFIPDELRPFPPGSPYECDNMAHHSGASFDNSNTIVVYDDNNTEIWRCDLSYSDLEAQGITVDSGEEIYISEEPEGTVVFYGAQGEKGQVFSNEFRLTSPFDPRQLKITISDFDGWEMISGVEYAGEGIENCDSDTTGKWSEARWQIVGDEEVYESEHREDE
jgi:hypothetical protein